MVLRIISLLACTVMSIPIGVGSYRLYPDADRIALAVTFVCSTVFAIAFAQWSRPRRVDLQEDEFVYFAVAYSTVICCGSMWLAEHNSPFVASAQDVIVRF